MKITGAVIFFTVFFAVYASINAYIFRRGWQALSGTGMPFALYLTLVLVLALAYPAGRFAERLWRNTVTESIVYVGAFYLAFMIYFFLFVVFFDLLRLADRLFPFFPAFLRQFPQKAAQATFFVVTAATCLIVAAGYFIALNPRLRTLDLSVAKPAGELRHLEIVVASDIHIGTIVRESRLERIVEKINSLEPDVVLLPGDIVDEDIPEAIEEKMVGILRRIRAPFGVFSVTGNHEYYGGLAMNIDYLERGGVRVLQDEVVKIGGSFYVIGRKDRTALRFGEERKTLEEIMEEGGVDSRLPLILLDHQPLDLEEAARCGVDLQLSGHTHNGQLFPLNLINKMFYELKWGYLKKENTHYFVTCGAGTWGPPVRTAGPPEIVRIRLDFSSVDLNSGQL